MIAFLPWKVAKGNNWARITLFVFFLVGLLPFVFILQSELACSAGLAALSIVQAVLQAFSLVLVFANPANEWFRGVAAKGQPLGMKQSEMSNEYAAVVNSPCHSRSETETDPELQA